MLEFYSAIIAPANSAKLLLLLRFLNKDYDQSQTTQKLVVFNLERIAG